MARAKFDIKTEATRPLYAAAGVTDLAVAVVRSYVTEAQQKVADVQKSVDDLDLQPRALRDQAVTVVSSRVDALAKDAQARRAAIEARVADLQSYPGKVQGLVDDNVAAANQTYGGLVTRGETLVRRIRRQETTRATVTSAGTTSAKARTTATQAKKATTSASGAARKTSSTASTSAQQGAKKTTSTAKRSAATAKKAPAKKASTTRSSSKATTTAAKSTASDATRAASDAAAKVGD